MGAWKRSELRGFVATWRLENTGIYRTGAAWALEGAAQACRGAAWALKGAARACCGATGRSSVLLERAAEQYARSKSLLGARETGVFTTQEPIGTRENVSTGHCRAFARWCKLLPKPL